MDSTLHDSLEEAGKPVRVVASTVRQVSSPVKLAASPRGLSGVSGSVDCHVKGTGQGNVGGDPVTKETQSQRRIVTRARSRRDLANRTVGECYYFFW